MRFMGLIKAAEGQTPPPALFEAMGKFVGEAMQAGVIDDTGGLMPSREGVRFRISNGELSVTDGPFAETKEVVGGYAIFKVDSREQALEWTRRFMELHRQHWPEFEGESELRQIEEMDGPPGA